MKHLKIYEEFNIKDIPNFAIDIRFASNEDLMKILNIIEKQGKLQFNGADNKIDFINYRDKQGRAWCWIVEPRINYWEGKLEFYISGVHTSGWYSEDLMVHIIDGKDFIKLGFEESLKNFKFYPEYDAEYKNMFKTANKYNFL